MMMREKREWGGSYTHEYDDELEESVGPLSGDVQVRRRKPVGPGQPWWRSLFSLVSGPAENTASSLVDVS